MIAKKRSDFEHKLNARGSQPSDYARYAEYETNLDSLRRKRMKRMGLKHTGHAGQRRIFFILDRATRKFHGDIGLWMQYIEFARKQKANKKLSQILTSLLRLHPTKPALWIYAANYALEEKSDMTEARSYMQRALRFCKHSRNLWLEYAKLEMIYISRAAARSRVLGRLEPYNGEADRDGDMLQLPAFAVPEMDPDAGFDEPVDKGVLAELDNIPALSGAIPMAIFDAAMKHFNGDTDFGQQFFGIVASFQEVPCVVNVLQHVVDGLKDASPTSPQTLSCFIQQPTLGVESASAEFPAALSTSLGRLRSSMDTISTMQGTKKGARSRSSLAHQIIEWILRYLGINNVDSDIALVLAATLKKTWTQFLTDLEDDPGVSADEFAVLLGQFRAQGLEKLAVSAMTVGSRIWPKDGRFFGGGE